MTRTINIKSLNIDQELVFSNVECGIDANLISGSTGSLVFKGNDRFQYRTFVKAPYVTFGEDMIETVYYELSIIDPQIRKAVTSLLNRGYYCITDVCSKVDVQNEQNIVIMYLAFFIDKKRMGELPILISDKVKNSLKKKKLLEEGADINSLFIENFVFVDGVNQNGCFAFMQAHPKDVFKNEADKEEVSYATEEQTDADNAKKLEDIDSEDKAAPELEKMDEITETQEASEAAPSTDGAENRDEEQVGEEQDTEIGLEGEEAPPSLTAEGKGFILFGKRFNLVVAIEGEADSPFLITKRAIFSMYSATKMNIGIGKLSFKDNAEVLDERIIELFSPSGEYVKTWEQYSSMEGEFMLKRAREIGILKFDKDKKTSVDESGNIEIVLDERSKKALSLLTINDNLDCLEEPPIYLQQNISWQEYKSGKKDIDKDVDAAHGMTEHLENLTVKDKVVNNRPLAIKKIDLKTCSIVLDTSSMPKGYLVLSLRGYQKQIERRETARENIMHGESPNSRIARIISSNFSNQEEQAGLKVIDTTKKIPALSPLVLKKIFTNEPTLAQEKAIEIALNTPDIAIIQGPPGTGKTTVITAIMERLNELSDKNSATMGNILITSLQHDAVNNVIDRIRINSLPTIKFGRKLDNQNTLESSVQQWCDQVAKNILAQNPSLKENVTKERLVELFNHYFQTPTVDNAIKLLEYMRTCGPLHQNLLQNINEKLNDLRGNSSSDQSELLVKIRRLRVEGREFMDDGPEAAKRLYFALEEFKGLGVEEKQEINTVLIKAARLENKMDDEIRAVLKANNKELLQELKRVKAELLEKCIPRPTYRISEPDEEIITIYEEVKKELSKSNNKLDEILLDLLHELENNQENIRATVANYSYVFAATAQQSEGKEIRKAKGLSRKDQAQKHPEYDTVIVDEAARVNPGDLMVPLSQAKERIILVGDHRQLPHMYDQEIFDALTEQGIEFQEADVQVSMFQQLLNKAKALENIDGIKRFVTLDKQYRTHPLLGEFVSKEYYEPYNEGYESPLKEEYFKQEHFPKPLVWISVPYAAGSEDKRGTSRFRNIEAKIIAARIAECVKKDDLRIQQEIEMEEKVLADMSLERKNGALDRKKRELEHKRLSYGVITFYSAQVVEIIRALKKELPGRAEELFKAEKLRVGSVDAFQGMEFDVIFLSVVRTGLNPDGFDIDKDKKMLDKADNPDVKGKLEKIAAKNYGFLTSPNRMCVAMSRQKKVLVVVGDSNIFVGEKYAALAEKFVPGMKHLYELSLSKGAVENV